MFHELDAENLKDFTDNLINFAKPTKLIYSTKDLKTLCVGDYKKKLSKGEMCTKTMEKTIENLAMQSYSLLHKSY